MIYSLLKYFFLYQTPNRKDFDLICGNAILFNMPKTTIYNQANKLKKFGDRAFSFFKDLLESDQKEFLKYSKKLFPSYYHNQFKKEIDEYQLDILYEHPQANPQTRIKMIESTKNNNVKRKNQNKEIIIEISGLNHLLPPKSELDLKKSAFQQNYDGEAIQPEEDISASPDSDSEEKSEILAEKKIPKKIKLPPKESIRLVEDLLNQDVKNKPFFYFNPVPI